MRRLELHAGNLSKNTHSSSQVTMKQVWGPVPARKKVCELCSHAFQPQALLPWVYDLTIGIFQHNSQTLPVSQVWPGMPKLWKVKGWRHVKRQVVETRSKKFILKRSGLCVWATCFRYSSHCYVCALLCCLRNIVSKPKLLTAWRLMQKYKHNLKIYCVCCSVTIVISKYDYFMREELV